MDTSNHFEAPRSERFPPDDGPLRPQRKRPSRAFIGALAGPLLGVLFFQAVRISPPGPLWWEGKGGSTVLTSLGRTISIVLLITGMIVGLVCGSALDARSSKRMTSRHPPRGR
jgi:hypothetical protein